MLRYHLITYGCQMNKNDSERIAGLLESMGMTVSQESQGSDVIVLNTCSVRQHAEDRVFGQMEYFAKLKQEKPDMVLAVTGCMPGRDAKKIFHKKMPWVDFYFPIKDLPQLPRWLCELRPAMANTGELQDDYFAIKPKRHTNKFQAYVSISAGCDNYCTFCVVPASRGRERSRPLADVLAEVRSAVGDGAVEITLLGQNVNTYRPHDLTYHTVVPRDGMRSRAHASIDRQASVGITKNNPFIDPFGVLLWELNQMPTLKRIHFTAPNPQDMTQEVIEALSLPKHVNYLHIPVQSGANSVLKRMNRRYSREQFFEMIDAIRAVRPSIALGTDIIVGFPGETEVDFNETLDLYQRVGFDISYNAMYSFRSGTTAARFFPDDVTQDEKKRRWTMLQDYMEEQTLNKNQCYQEQIVEVLVERFDETRNICSGNSREMKLVEFPGSRSLVGTIVSVRINQALTWILRGSLTV